MDRQGLTGELKLLLGDYLRSLGLILVDLIFRHEGKDLVLRVFADKPEGGINMDECAKLNRGIGGIIDEKGIIKDRYILEVASPGLDRPLKNREDFLLSLNKKAKFFLSEKINGKLEWDGIISDAKQESVFIKVSESVIELPFLKINKARLII